MVCSHPTLILHASLLQIHCNLLITALIYLPPLLLALDNTPPSIPHHVSIDLHHIMMHHPSTSKSLYKPPTPAPLPPHRTQHHRLQPTSTTSNPSVLTSGPPNPRLNELFDLIQNEFDSTGQDGALWRSQRDEYEQKSELGPFWHSRLRLHAHSSL